MRGMGTGGGGGEVERENGVSMQNKEEKKNTSLSILAGLLCAPLSPITLLLYYNSFLFSSFLNIKPHFICFPWQRQRNGLSVILNGERDC